MDIQNLKTSVTDQRLSSIDCTDDISCGKNRVAELVGASVNFIRSNLVDRVMGLRKRAVHAKVERTGTRKNELNIIVYFSVNKPCKEVYQFCRNLKSFPSFMTQLGITNAENEIRSGTKSKRSNNPLPANCQMEIENEIENQLIAWRSMENSRVHLSGRVDFLEKVPGQTTEVYMIFNYEPVGARKEACFASLMPAIKSILIERVKKVIKIIEMREVPSHGVRVWI